MNNYISWWQLIILIVAATWLLLWFVPVIADFLTQGGVKQRRTHNSIINYLLATRERAQEIVPRMRSQLHCASLQADGLDEFWRILQETSEIKCDSVLDSLLADKLGEAVTETVVNLSFEQRKQFIDNVGSLIRDASTR